MGVNGPMTLPALGAVVDIGTHSVRLELFQVHADGSFASFESLIRPINLGHDVAKTESISPENINLLCSIAADFAGRIAEYEVRCVRAVATSALREAFNRELVAYRIKCASGLDVEVLESQEEARLLYLGLRETLEADGLFPSRRALVFVVGTGSLIVMYLDRSRLQFCEPIPLGSMHLHDEYGSRSVGLKRISALLETFCLEQRLSDSTNFDPAEPMSIIGIGAGVRALVDMRFSAGAARGRVVRMAPADLDGILLRAQRSTPDELVRDYRLSDTDAENVGPTAEIAGYFLHEMNCREAIFPEVTTRSVLMREMIRLGHDEADPFEPELLTAVANIGRKYDLDGEHTKAVAAMALKLFDKLKKRYHLTPRQRLQLEMAAILHDIGRFVDLRQHHKHSMYLIDNAQIPGVAAGERTLVAMIARYHRRSEPKSSHPEYLALPPQDKVSVQLLAAILRLADAAVNGGAAAGVKVSLTADGLVFRLPAPVDIEWEMLCLERKGGMFRSVYGLDFKVEEELAR